MATQRESFPRFGSLAGLQSAERASVCSCAVVLVMLVGCNRSSQESQVSGRVTLDGNRIGLGTIVFAPIDGGKPATGSIEADGSYTVKTSRELGLARRQIQGRCLNSRVAGKRETERPAAAGQASDSGEVRTKHNLRPRIRSHTGPKHYRHRFD